MQTTQFKVMKTIITLFFLFFIFASCKSKTTHSFVYTNGERMSDSNQIKVLERELLTLLSKDDLKQNLKIYTSLSKNQNDDFQSISERYRSYVLDTLKSIFPGKSSFLDSINQNYRLSNLGIVCINNRTGEVKNCAFNQCSSNVIFENRLENKAIHPFGYILTFQKGKELQDTFANEINQHVEEQFKVTRNYTVEQSFTMISSGKHMIRPYYFYSKSEWEKVSNQLHVNLDLSEFQPGIIPRIKTSLLDLTKTLATIQQNGVYRKPLFIRKITNMQGKVIYTTAKSTIKTVLDEKVVLKMKQLFNSYMHGQGMIHYRKNGIFEDCFIFTGELSNDANWCIYSGQNYTLGIIEYNQIKSNSEDTKMNRNKEKLKVSLILKEVLKSLNQNKTKGELFYHLNAYHRLPQYVDF